MSNNIICFLTADNSHYTMAIDHNTKHDSDYINNILESDNNNSSIMIGPICYNICSIKVPFTGDNMRMYFSDPYNDEPEKYLPISLFFGDSKSDGYGHDFINRYHYKNSNVDQKLNFINDNILFFDSLFDRYPNLYNKFRALNWVKRDDILGKYIEYTSIDKFNGEIIRTNYLNTLNAFVIRTNIQIDMEPQERGLEEQIIIDFFSKIEILGMKYWECFTAEIGDSICSVYKDGNEWIALIYKYQIDGNIFQLKYKIVSNVPIEINVDNEPNEQAFWISTSQSEIENMCWFYPEMYKYIYVTNKFYVYDGTNTHTNQYVIKKNDTSG